MILNIAGCGNQKTVHTSITRWMLKKLTQNGSETLSATTVTADVVFSAEGAEVEDVSETSDTALVRSCATTFFAETNSVDTDRIIDAARNAANARFPDLLFVIVPIPSDLCL